MEPSGRDEGRRLPIILRRVQRERTGRGLALTVLCPNAHRVLNLDQCRGCEHSCGLCFNTEDGEIFLRCRRTSQAVRPVDPRQHVIRESVASLLATDAPVLGEDAGLRAMLAHFADHAVGAVPVTSLDGRPIGIVHKSDVVRALDELEGVALSDGSPADVPKLPRARDLMRRALFTLHPDDDIAAAAALMGYEQVDAVLVQSTDVLAALTSFEVLRYLARMLG